MEFCCAGTDAIFQIREHSCFAIFKAGCDLRYGNVTIGKVCESLLYLSPFTRFLLMFSTMTGGDKRHWNK